MEIDDETLSQIDFETLDGDSDVANAVDFGTLNKEPSAEQPNVGPQIVPNAVSSEVGATAEILQEITNANEHFIKEKLNKNTVRSMEGSTRRFQSFLEKKGVTTSMLSLPATELDQYLAGWLLSMKKQNGEDYEPTTLTANLRGVAKYFTMNGSKLDIVHDDAQFTVTHKVLSARKRELKQKGKGNVPNRASMLETHHEEQLWAKGALGRNDPETLLHTVWYFTTKLLGFRGSHEARQLKWGDFTVVKDMTGQAQFITWNERETKTRHGDGKCSGGSRAFAPKLFPNKQNPERCPVAAYQDYLSRRPADTMSPDSPFYLAVNYNRPTADSKWFKKTAMGHDRIGSIMARMAAKAGLQGRFTNHSVRRTMCTQLMRAGVPPILVAQLTGHKNIASLSRYTTASLEQQQQMSSILQGNATNITGSSLQNYPAEQPTLPQPVDTLALAASSQPSFDPPATRVQTHLVHSQSDTSLAMRHVSGIFSGATFTNIGSFHIHF